jgi:hypothetical protein
MSDKNPSSKHFAQFDAPDLPPFLAVEPADEGWRGLTEDGEVFNVHGDGIPLDGQISVIRNGETIGYRKLPKKTTAGVIDDYLAHFASATELMRMNANESALTAIELAIQVAPTMRAHFNRAMILLALGRWIEGFGVFHHCEGRWPFMRPVSQALADRGVKRWTGEPIEGKRLLLVHDHGFGDSIMMLRYVRPLQAAGAHVALMMPPELGRLAAQLAPVVPDEAWRPVDYFCTMFGLTGVLHVTPDSVPLGPYLKPDPLLVDKWRGIVGGKNRRRIGIAWSVGLAHDGDYPRGMPLAMMTRELATAGADLISIQQDTGAEADMLGVDHYRFEDFADCAALISLLDEVVTIDTAALHLAGAIGHPKIVAMLSHWSSWRWLSRLYSNVTFCKQERDGDWESAFAQRRRAQ